jgi:thioredoxin
MSSLPVVTDATFSALAETPRGVLTVVDLWAPWCGPCRTLTPIIEAAAGKHPDVRFLALNIEDSPKTPQRFSVRSIPTLLVLLDGELVHQSAGLIGPAQLEGMLQKFTPAVAR